MRSSTYLRLCASMTTDSMPWRCRRCERSRPAGPAATMPTCVRIFLASAPSVAIGSRLLASLQRGEDFLGRVEGAVGRGHAAIDRGLQQHLLDLLALYAVLQRGFHMQLELLLPTERDR